MLYKMPARASNPILFVILLDQSGSMSEFFGNSNISKAQGIADNINRLLYEIILHGRVGDKVRDYYHIAILGYGASSENVMSVFGGELANKEFMTIGEIAAAPLRVEDRIRTVPDGAGGIVDVILKTPIWVEPIAGADTPMVRAFERAENLITKWVQRHPSSFPPIVINISDGEATDGDPSPYAHRIKNIQLEDGNVLLFNCFISSTVTEPIRFPENATRIQDTYGKKLFKMSSVLPPSMVKNAQMQGIDVGNNSRGFIYQPDKEEIIKFLGICIPPEEEDVFGSEKDIVDSSKNYKALSIFLCHSSNDKPQVRELYKRLKSKRFDPWLDEEKLLPGQIWQLEIKKAVKKADIVIVCLSRGSITKVGYIQKEISYALDFAEEQPEGKLFLIPLKLEECEVPERLSKWHWNNYFDKNGYEKLLEALQYAQEQRNAA
jgi:hypothetical protein